MRKNNLFLLSSILLSFSLTGFSSVADEMQISPGKCITMKQGQVCYQDVQIQWQSEQAGDYCLRQHLLKQPLKCWENSQRGEYRFEFQARQTTQIHLTRKGDSTQLASDSIKVKWVYHKRQKRFGWRVF